jgi:predicted GNAT superfamily acetyltransferase
MAKHAHNSKLRIRELTSLADFEQAFELEKEVWRCSEADITPLALAVATQNAGSVWLGGFDGAKLIGFVFAFPSLHGQGARPSNSAPCQLGFHSHTLAVREPYRDSGVGYELKLAQRQKVLGLGIREMTWTFDPLRSRNAHLNFSKLGVISNSYRVDFYGSALTSPLDANRTDRLWVTWRMSDQRTEQRLRGKAVRSEVLDALTHLSPLVRFHGDGVPVVGDLSQALARQRIAIEIPGDIERIEREDRELAGRWRLATRRAFTESLEHGFVVTEFCRSIRGQQGPGAYLLERES